MVAADDAVGRRRPPAEKPDEDELVRRLRARDDGAVETLIGRYEAKVFGLALRLTGNRPDAEEVLQDVFWTVVDRIESFRGDAKLSSWMYRITTNAALMKLRKRSGRRELPLEELGPAMSPEGEIAERVVDWTRRPGQELERKELGERLAAALDELPAEYRAVVVVRDVEGMPAAEACEVLDLSLPALKSRLHRARLFLRKRLAEYMAGIGGGFSAPNRRSGDAPLP
jgi:RNA polymerase sigma-70 factor, ECF subfamily